MPSSSRRSAESAGPPAEPGTEPDPEQELMRRRFVEALRRAEIISLISAVEDEAELGRVLSEELCEVYDAEIGIVVEIGAGRSGREIGMHGVSEEAVGGVIGAGELTSATEVPRALSTEGEDLLGVGARATLLASFDAGGSRHLVIGVGRMYPLAFDEPEVALLEAVAVNAGQALERLWARNERNELIGELKAAFVGTAEALANALEAKDLYTADHASEVGDLAVAVGRELGLGEEQLEQLRYGAIFHDIGKIAIPDAILNKAGPLTEEERAAMMEHPRIGAEMIAPIPFLGEQVREMVGHDHEHFDGSGYPDGLSGEEIPLGARIILVVDSFHAMISDRPYRKAMPEREARAELERCAGTQFDPAVVAAFRRIEI